MEIHRFQRKKRFHATQEQLYNTGLSIYFKIVSIATMAITFVHISNSFQSDILKMFQRSQTITMILKIQTKSKTNKNYWFMSLLFQCQCALTQIAGNGLEIKKNLTASFELGLKFYSPKCSHDKCWSRDQNLRTNNLGDNNIPSLSSRSSPFLLSPVMLSFSFCSCCCQHSSHLDNFQEHMHSPFIMCVILECP